MDVLTRTQGRPARGDGEVGRRRLLERTRDILKTKPKIDLQRREIALAAGVTPALVSYYYPDKWDLLAAAAKPVVEAYTAEARAILTIEEEPERKLRALTLLFVGFNFENGHLLDFYLENSERMARREDMQALREIGTELHGFFDGLLRTGVLKGEDATLVQSSLWGMCKHLAHKLTARSDFQGPEALARVADQVADIFLHGAMVREGA